MILNLKYKILIVSLAILLMADSAIPSLVLCLCYCDDEHIAVEIAHNRNCKQVFSDSPISTAQMDAMPLSAKSLLISGHSGTCVDIPLENSAIIHHIASLRKAFTKYIRLTFTTSTFLISTFTGKLIVGLFALPPPIFNSTLSSLRTVVLLN